MAADIDVRIVAKFTTLTESSLTTLLDNPTTDLVKTLLSSLEKRAKEHEFVKSQKIKNEVELETVVRQNESKTKVLVNSRDKALADASKLRESLQAVESTRVQAQSELERLQQSMESEASETMNLRRRIASLESSHRDSLSLLDSKSKEVDRLAQDLTNEHQKLVELRKENSQLEQGKQEASSAATSAKFRQSSLEQELELQKKNVEWYENERKIKAEEHQTFRKEKNAKISELQRSAEQHIEQIQSLKRSENALRSQIEDQEKRNEDLVNQLAKAHEQATTEAEEHRIELDSSTRLYELQKDMADRSKNRVDELNSNLEELKQDASDELARTRAECQEEHNERQAAEQRVAELESRIAELEADLHQAQNQPATPRNETNGQLLLTPARPGTPLGSFTPRSTHRLKNGLSTTQLYSEFTKLEKELVNERRISAQLQANVDQMLEDLEANQPEIQQLRDDQKHLQKDIVDMSQQTEEANQQRDAAVKEARILQGQLDAMRNDLEASQQTSRDLRSQIRRLILEQQAGALDDLEYQNLVHELEQQNQREMEHLSSTQQEVNQYLLGFRNIAELQSLNEKQLNTIRALAAKLESQDAKATHERHQQLEKDLDDAQSRISTYQDEIKNMVAQSKSFMKERDMFRSMLTRRGQMPASGDVTDFSRSMPLPAGGFATSITGDRASPSVENDLVRLLRDLQGQYDTYREEAKSGNDHMKTQINELQQRNSQLHTEASRSLGQLTAAQQRADMLQANYNTLKADYGELQKRSNAAFEAVTKQELKTQQAAEDLVEARGMVDSLRRESANLKAEKDLWKTIEKRLLDDNEDIRNSKVGLDQINSSLQNMLNEKEHSDSESRRRLQSQVDNLESELQSTKRKLEEEVDDKKQNSLRRTYEQEQSQKRIDDLVASLGAAREELASSKTTRDHMQARIDELTVELRSAEERLEVIARPPSNTQPATNGDEANSLSQKQELAFEVSELKRDLELKSAELAKADEHVEEYKAIAQGAEERLQQFTETNDEDKADLQATINAREQTIRDLQQRVEDISTELSTSNSELSKLRDEQAEAGRKLDEQRALLQAEIDRLKLSEEKAWEQANFNLEASKAQAEIATEAQQNYETELLKHAEAAKNLQTVRAEANQVRLELAEAKNHANNAKADLEQKEASWAEMKARFQQESVDLKSRREEVEQHNKNLHASLETLNKQLASLQRSRATLGNDEAESSQSVSNDLSSLNEIIKYLRQEKEIVEVRHHMATLELERVKRQLESTQGQLDDARLKLDQQQRAAIDFEKNAMNHNKLMETLNELNMHRESMVTLRAEKRQVEQTLNEKARKLEEMEQEIVPLKARIAEVEHLLELRQGEMELLQKDRDSWQQRTQNILSKYDRPDPAEMEELKTRVAELESERDGAVAAQVSLQTQINAHPEAVEAAKSDLRKRLQEQFKGRDREMRERRVELQNELNTVKEQLESAQAQLKEAAATATAPTSNDQEEGQISAKSQEEVNTRVTQLEARVQELETSIAEKDEQIALQSTKVEEYKAREEQMKDRLNKRLAEFKKEAENAKQVALDAERETLKAQHEEELQKLRTQHVDELEKMGTQPAPVSAQAQQAASANETDETVHSDGYPASFEELVKNITAEQAKLLVQSNTTVSNIVRTNIRNKVEKETAALKEQLEKLQPTASAEDITEQLADAEKRFAEQREELIRQKDEEFSSERETLVKEQQELFEAEKKAILEEHRQKLADEITKAKAATEKMTAGKLKLVQTQSNNNLAKVNAVKKAVEETPEKPVKEVWDVAKSAKPAADPPKPLAATPTATQVTPTPVPTTTTAPTADGMKAEEPGTNGAASPAPVSDPQDTDITTEPSQPAQAVPAPANASQPARSTSIPQPASHLPRGNFSSRGQRGNAPGGRGTGIPRAGSVTGNHGGGTHVRSRGGNPGRGGHQGSPRGGGPSLNPAAQQFTPGKRQREEGEDAGNMGKRIRGGSAGS